MTKKFCCMRKWSGLWRVSVYVCVLLAHCYCCTNPVSSKEIQISPNPTSIQHNKLSYTYTCERVRTKIFRLRLRSGLFLFFWWEVQSSRRFVTETRQWLLWSCEREREREIELASWHKQKACKFCHLVHVLDIFF